MQANFRNLRLETGAGGVGVLRLDVPEASLNPLSDAVVAELDQALSDLLADEAIHGIVITSGKDAFAAGWNLKEIDTLMAGRPTPEQVLAATPAFSRFLRRLETCGKPVVAAINGLALGGGLELALACHQRLLANRPGAVVGLPEVKVGLLPGAGGTQRLPRLIGLEPALRAMLEGNSLEPAEALELGIVDRLVEPTALLGEAILAAGAPGAARVQPWDLKGFVVPGRLRPGGPGWGEAFASAVAAATRNGYGNYPAPLAILSASYEGLQLPIDRGLAVERDYFARLAAGSVARNLVRTMFINRQRAEKLAARPAGIPPTEVTTVAVLGAGMMGAGLAYVLARSGIRCRVIDRTPDIARGALAYAERALQREIKSGRLDEEAAARVMDRIQPGADFAELGDCTLAIEAVFEDREVKADVTRRAECMLPPGALFASNTSTLPISGLAEASRDPTRFIGLHFFSPVERMPLVEVIRGRQTSDESTAHALDLVKRLRKTPIVVNDSRGFFTSRVFATYCYEGQMLLLDGVSPALIENAGRFAGMPVGPLAVMDEVSLELQYHVVQQARVDLGSEFVEPPSWQVLRLFVEELKRMGRKSGGGFYDYPAGEPKRLWNGLAQFYPTAASQPSLDEVKTRLLYIQALEAARCRQEGVVTSAADADLGSILGWGFPSWSGGVLSLVDTIGAAEFVRVAKDLAARHGPRFEPCDWLVGLADRNGSVHDLD
ncbi:MAG: FAD-dependent oxidoreductase [Steroidobacteraceae bacterium]